ncbi:MULTISPECIES: hypothetical protein [unclassified Streptomyces]|uniref:hypothetical protein n=1 Tax=Streptomyces TaxID=1883 RepID=UPI00081B4C40|nr:hypothetical protein [Streptomyces sp. BvitLS-983]MYX88457.1 hypothetical protein [Streptomyces sp. SID4915]SCE16940.1 hypothetical protein GA0115250_144788 [Streptomyces sp. BvitLS-983]
MTNRPITPAEAHLVATAVTLAATKGETVCRAVASTFTQDQLAAAKEVLENDLNQKPTQ